MRRAIPFSLVLSIVAAANGAAGQATDDRVRELIAEGDRLSVANVQRWEEAESRFVEADRLAQTSGDPALRALAHQRLGYAYFNSSKLTESVRVSNEAADLAEAAGAPAIKGLARRMQGASLIMLARHAEAETVLIESAQLSEQFGTIDDAIRALSNLSANARLQGQLGEAVAYGRRAVAVVDRELAKGVTLSSGSLFAAPFNLGKSLADSGDFIAAGPYLDGAFNIAVQYNNLGAQQHLLGDSGEWYEMQGDTTRAARYFRRLIEFCRLHWKGAEGEGKGLLGLGRIAIREGRPREALPLISEAIQIFRDSEFVHLLTAALVQRARAHADAGDADRAARDLEDVIALATRAQQTSNLVLALIERGTLRTHGGTLAAARHDFDSAISLIKRDRLMPLLPSAYVGLGTIEEARRDPTAALNAYEQAADALDQIRGRIVSPEMRANFSAATHNTFAGLTRALMALHTSAPQGGYDRRALLVLERERLQALDLAVMETRAGAAGQRSPQTRIAQLQTALFAPDVDSRNRQTLLVALDDAERDLSLSGGNSGAMPPRPRVPQFEHIQSALAPNEVIIQYALLRDRAIAFVATREQLRVVPLHAPGDLDDRIEFFSRALAENARPASIAAGRRLSAMLLAPILPEIPPGSRILIVATGELARLPFAALPVTRAGGVDAPLLTRHEIAYLPSLTLFAEHRTRSASRDWSVLAVADAGPSEAISRGLAPLPGARAEARAIAALSSSSRVLMGLDATEHRMKSHVAGGFSVLHFATHAVLDPAVPERSAVLLTAADGDDGLLQAREIYELPLQGSLVVLSGCRTADGRTSGAEGLRSIARAFLQAGGRSVVGALWDVPDSSAARLVIGFYSQLRRERDAGAAMRRAQLAAAGRDPYGNSRTWASIVLLGDPALGLASRGRGQAHWALAAPAALLITMLIVMLNSRRR